MSDKETIEQLRERARTEFNIVNVDAMSDKQVREEVAQLEAQPGTAEPSTPVEQGQLDAANSAGAPNRETGTGEGDEDSKPKGKSLSKMNRKELEARATELEVDTTDFETNQDFIDGIKEAEEEDEEE